MKTKLLLLSFLIASCTTQKSFVKYGTKHKDKASEFCSSMFPLKPSSVTQIEAFIPSENIDWSKTIDSLRNALIGAKSIVKIDTIYSQTECNEKLQQQAKTIEILTSVVAKFQNNYKPCKPDTLKITNTITVPDSAKIYSLEAKLKAEHEKLIKTEANLKSMTNDRNLILLILFSLVLILGILKFARVI